MRSYICVVKAMAILHIMIFLFGFLETNVVYHYCLGEVQNVAVGYHTDYRCCPETSADVDCCSNEIYTSQISDWFASGMAASVELPPFAVTSGFTTGIQSDLFFALHLSYNTDIEEDPPPRIPLYITHVALITYG